MNDLQLYRIDSEHRAYTVRISVPDYSVSVPNRDLSAGTFTESGGRHGLLVRAGDPDDLRAIAQILTDAADEIQEALHV